MRIGTFIAITLACFAAFFAAGFLTGKKRAESRSEGLIQTDTITRTIHDTILRERPVFVAKTEIRTDTVRLALVDSSHTVVVRDSAEVEVPISRKVYEDSTYRAVISGYKANLDSLWVYHTIREINVVRTQKTAPKRWGFDVALGPSVLVTPKGDVKGGIGITGGLSYRF